METDIEVLESIVKVHNDFLKGCNNETINEKEIQAIENVLNRVKELEEQNKQLTDAYLIQKDLINAEFLSNYVGKDRIKEYINSLSNKLKEYKTNLGGKEYIDMSYLDKKEKELVNNIIVQIATLKDLL